MLPKPEYVPDVDVKIVDGAALVHIILYRNKCPSLFETFNDYAQLVLLLYIERMLQDDRECCLGRLGPIGRTS